ncbi:hypothetical protein GCM10023178_20190 [Actinomadura luteofluorescens]
MGRYTAERLQSVAQFVALCSRYRAAASGGPDAGSGRGGLVRPSNRSMRSIVPTACPVLLHRLAARGGAPGVRARDSGGVASSYPERTGPPIAMSRLRAVALLTSIADSTLRRGPVA